MGTDIHAIIQVNTPLGWEYVGTGPCDDDGSPLLMDRNYALFSILAGVRNGTGFAGVPTGTAVQPISEPRGLPDPLGAVPTEDGEPIWIGDHSISWVTLRELETFPWDEPRGRSGVIKACRYDAFRRDNDDRSRPPDGGWCGDICGRGIVVLEELEYLERLKSQNLPSGDLYVRVTWMQRHIDLCSTFYGEVLPYLRQLADQNHLDADAVRIVFGFDS